MMFDLRANFTVKAGGKEQFGESIRSDKYFMLCVDQEVFQELFD